ncbi:MAG TPA: sulfite exporter TauE/SafE family protein [Candidatus Aphodovivens avistercoris]|nr:sulfite exporter TauE/SafE family protein [Candidatus Aphodovivens avistercoris]
MEVLATFGAPAAVGLFIGVLSGLLGIGGGTIMVPVFRLGFGLSPLLSTATSLFTIIPTSISGAVSHLKGKTCVPSLGLAMGLGGAVTSPIGVWLASLSPSWLVMLGAALCIGYSAVNMLGKAIKVSPKPSKQDGVANGAEGGEAPEAADPAAPAAPKLTRKQLVIGACIGLGAGLASGYVGLGGGFIMVPLMLSFVGIPMKLASGTSLIAVLLLAIPGTVENGLAGNIDYVVGLSVAVGSIPGAIIGARLVSMVPERALRFVFGGFLIVAAVVLFLNEFGILG